MFSSDCLIQLSLDFGPYSWVYVYVSMVQLLMRKQQKQTQWFIHAKWRPNDLCLLSEWQYHGRTKNRSDGEMGVSTLNSSVSRSAQNPQPSSRHHVMFQIETWFQQNKTICYIKLNINMNSVGFIVLFIYNLNFHLV